MDDPDIRWRQSLDKLSKAFALLDDGCIQDTFTLLEEQGLIKCFEDTFELAWNALRDYLEYQGHIDLRGPRDVINKGHEVGLTRDREAWMEMLLNRSRTSFTWDAVVAKEVQSFIQASAVSLFRDLIERLSAQL